MPPADRPTYDQDTATVRTLLGSEGAAVWAAGRALPLEAAIGAALDVLDRNAQS
jgi:hypothetical protein